jgi:tetratricopeptide (TPR) repeat protein
LSPFWPISAGELFELTRPAAFVLSALASAWVLSSARRYGFTLYAAAAWTLSTLFYPLIILPIYLIVRAARRRAMRADATDREQTEETPASSIQLNEEQSSEEQQPVEQSRPALRMRRTLPLVYLLAVLSLGAFLYYREAQSLDAHLARANHARLLGQREKTIREYRAALKLEENAHTRNLLGIELLTAGQLEEALAEFRAAQSGGEPDDELPYRIAVTLDALKRPDEAIPEYQKFLNTQRCASSYQDAQCAASRVRVEK